MINGQLADARRTIATLTAQLDRTRRREVRAIKIRDAWYKAYLELRDDIEAESRGGSHG